MSWRRKLLSASSTKYEEGDTCLWKYLGNSNFGFLSVRFFNIFFITQKLSSSWANSKPDQMSWEEMVIIFFNFKELRDQMDKQNPKSLDRLLLTIFANKIYRTIWVNYKLHISLWYWKCSRARLWSLHAFKKILAEYEKTNYYIQMPVRVQENRSIWYEET